jgi:hypothetical protein
VKGPWDTNKPVAMSIKEGEPWPEELRGPGWVATADVEFYREGMPTHGLKVSTPHRIIAAYQLRCEYSRRELREHERDELRTLVGDCQLSAEDRATLDKLTA